MSSVPVTLGYLGLVTLGFYGAGLFGVYSMKTLSLMCLISWFAAFGSAQQFDEESLNQLFSEIRQTENSPAGRKARLAYVRQWAKLETAEIRATIPAVVGALGDPNVRVRTSASAMLSALSLVRADDVLDILTGYEAQVVAGFEDTAPQVRANLIRCFALAEPAPPALAVEPFTRAVMTDEPSEARSFAVVGLIRAAPGSLAAVDAVIDLMDRANEAERSNIIQSVGSTGVTHPILIAKIVDQLDSQDPHLVHAAISAISRIGIPAAQAAEKLQDLAENPTVDEDTRRHASGALEYVTGKKGIPR